MHTHTHTHTHTDRHTRRDREREGEREREIAIEERGRGDTHTCTRTHKNTATFCCHETTRDMVSFNSFGCVPNCSLSTYQPPANKILTRRFTGVLPMRHLYDKPMRHHVSTNQERRHLVPQSPLTANHMKFSCPDFPGVVTAPITLHHV
jgi:hypothetical protein